MSLLLTTAFAFMSCDGEIVTEEIDLIRDLHSRGVLPADDIDVALTQLVDRLNANGKAFLESYTKEVEAANLSKEDALALLRVAVDTIYADSVVEYSEVKFFRLVRSAIHSLTDDEILEADPRVQDFWLEQDMRAVSVADDYYTSVTIPTFDLSTVKPKELK